MNSPEHLSRGINHLGGLGARLRDLAGFTTLANELIQNADDAPNVSFVRMSADDKGLFVDNDGSFSDCGDVSSAVCSWKNDPEWGHMCDFHRFRSVASGDKRQQKGTTGAFGIGFIAVYQITDQPELISKGRHWILQESEEENKRIRVCYGCTKCKQDGLPGTRFILPWAKNGDSDMRKALNADPITQNKILELLKEFKAAIPTSCEQPTGEDGGLILRVGHPIDRPVTAVLLTLC